MNLVLFLQNIKGEHRHHFSSFCGHAHEVPELNGNLLGATGSNCLLPVSVTLFCDDDHLNVCYSRTLRLSYPIDVQFWGEHVGRDICVREGFVELFCRVGGLRHTEEGSGVITKSRLVD